MSKRIQWSGFLSGHVLPQKIFHVEDGSISDVPLSCFYGMFGSSSVDLLIAAGILCTPLDVFDEVGVQLPARTSVFKRNKTTSLTVHLTAGWTTPEDGAHRWRQNVEQRFLPSSLGNKNLQNILCPQL